jgi:hypothetical protein
MAVWMVLAIWGGLVNVVVVLINWRGRTIYERARAASVVAMTTAVSAGGTVHDKRSDGTVVHIEVPGPEASAKSPGASLLMSNRRPRC